MLHELCLILFNFTNTTAYRSYRYEPSSPSTIELHPFCLARGMSRLMQTRLWMIKGIPKQVFGILHFCLHAAAATHNPRRGDFANDGRWGRQTTTTMMTIVWEVFRRNEKWKWSLSLQRSSHNSHSFCVQQFSQSKRNDTFLASFLPRKVGR